MGRQIGRPTYRQRQTDRYRQRQTQVEIVYNCKERKRLKEENIERVPIDVL